MAGSSVSRTASRSSRSQPRMLVRTTSMFSCDMASGVRTSGGFERLGPFAEVLDSDHPSIAEGRDLVVHLFVDLYTASLATPVVAESRRHIVSCVDKFLRVQPQLIERFV